ncbi:Ppx/GppA phosphatase family protein [Anaerosoma tenue]|uniref:Ppx/GppA phosphatase family protein n=1 Tax=Anaerosoma tenue TaxID=2933588 RepID=UPI0022609DD3|nr:Ppx/GppA phosphatase family protein [Anaerosoma tenue]MCK8115899.1 Ppx/GppA family phosphatase [Anaerosoma tenue]
MMGAERRAAIDIGTVTARLLVADVVDGEVHEVVRRSRITHLGEGWSSTGVLSAEGMTRVADAVAGFVVEARELGAARIVAVATSASRDARNSDEFLERLEAAGIRPQIISGSREGYLTFLGATYGIRDERVMVVDVGGGSTEIVLGTTSVADGRRHASIEAVRSVDVGSRRITEMFLESDPPARDEVERASAWVADELRPFFSALRERPAEMVSVAGTATSLAAIELELDPYDPERVHGYRLSGSSLLDTLDHLARMTLAERRGVTGLEPDRAGVIVAGAIVLQSVLAYAGLSSTLVSEHDILYGMMLDPFDDGGAG